MMIKMNTKSKFLFIFFLYYIFKAFKFYMALLPLQLKREYTARFLHKQHLNIEKMLFIQGTNDTHRNLKT